MTVSNIPSRNIFVIEGNGKPPVFSVLVDNIIKKLDIILVGRIYLRHGNI